jgi:CrcB protein
MHLLLHIGLVAFGSAVGGLARWGLTLTAARFFGTVFPWGTFFINISGCLFLGWFGTLLQLSLAQGLGWFAAEDLRLLVAVGFTGGYTTFSTFEYEANQMLGERGGFAGTTYLFASVFLGLAAAYLGAWLAR